MKSYDQIKQQLQAFEVDLDKEKLWANTAHAIPKKRRRNGLLVLLLGSVVLIGGALVVLLPQQSASGSSQAVETTTSLVNEDQKEAIVDIDAIEKSATQNSSENKLIFNQKQSPEGDDISSQSALSPKAEMNQAFVTMTNSNINSSTLVNQSTNVTERKIESIDDAMRFVEESTSDTEVDMGTGAEKDQLKNQSEVGGLTTLPSGVLAVPSNDFVFQQTVDIQAIEQLAMMRPDLVLQETPLIPFGNNSTTPLKRSISIDLYLTQSIGFSFLSIQAGSEELNQRAEILNQRIKSLENLSTRVGALFHVYDRWIVGGGFQRNQLTTQTDFSWVTEDRKTTEGVSEIVIDPDGTQHFQSGAVGVTRETQWQAYRYSTHTTVNFETQLAYKLMQHYRLDITAGIHGTYNLFYDTQGSIFGENDEPIRFASDDQPFKLTSPLNFGFSLTGSYQFNHRLGLQLSLQADRLQYREYIDQTPINYKHNIFALGIGLRYVL